ncbi:alpha/beta fold hydrolase [Brevibacillus reuszeri]|uniref:alpha/beta fold hydrolase n=1 Tax=Brevibacillus reuszeri TaxID=54915 RepID=UPI00289FEA06|nr:alpha/beta fold hydrolase [Brevibacillus reuszeri]
MRNTVKRALFFVLMLVLCWGNSAPSGWAEKSHSIVEEAWAWVENGELRIQAALAVTQPKILLTVFQDDEKKSLTLREESRLSVAINPSSTGPLSVQLRLSSQEKPIGDWQLTVPETVNVSDEGLTIREESWVKKADKKEDTIELIANENADEELNRDTDENGDGTEGSGQQDSIQEWADDFYDEFTVEDKSNEAALRSRAVIFELEPNDTFGKADWLFDGKDGRGRIAKSGDVDMWKIKATKDGMMNVSLREIPHGQDYNLYVYNAEQEEMGKSEKSGNSDESVEGIAIEKNKWYYVKVSGNGNSYHKDFYYVIRADVLADQEDGKVDEYEPNNTIQTAYELPSDYSASLIGNLHSRTDVDFYRFSFSLASTLFIDLKDMPEGMDIDLYLLDESGKELAKSEKPKNANEQIIFNTNPGTYLIKVMASKRSGFTPNSYKLTAVAKTIPVILIPGIGGSRLEAEEGGKTTEIWLGLGDSLVGINDPKHRRLLSLEPIQPNSVDVGPREQGVTIYPERAEEGFSAIEYLSYSPLDPIRNMTEQYYSMVKKLEKTGYRKHRTIFAMPYDWRYSSTKNSTYLKEKIDLALQRSGARQVHLVVHSMGGLLVRETLLSNVSYQSKVNRIVYMGTPFLGSPRAYQAIRFGYNFSIPWMAEDTGRIISEYAPAVYELLPSKKYFETVSFLKKNRNDLYTYDEFLQDKKVQLAYAPLVKQGGLLHEKWENKTINVPQYSIIGTGQPTFLGYWFDAYHNEWAPYYDTGLGDGTVPYISANYAQKDIKKRYYVAGEHAKLPTIPEVIEQVTQLLKGEEKVQPGLRNTATRKANYLYYVIFQEDRDFPRITFTKSGRTMTLDPEEREISEDLSIEYHNRIAVIRVLDDEEIEFASPVPQADKSTPRYFIDRFSSEDSKAYQETGRRYILDEAGLTEVSNEEAA